jgi:hypothetical protein
MQILQQSYIMPHNTPRLFNSLLLETLSFTLSRVFTTTTRGSCLNKYYDKQDKVSENSSGILLAPVRKNEWNFLSSSSTQYGISIIMCCCTSFQFKHERVEGRRRRRGLLISFKKAYKFPTLVLHQRRLAQGDDLKLIPFSLVSLMSGSKKGFYSKHIHFFLNFLLRMMMVCCVINEVMSGEHRKLHPFERI